MKDEFSMDNLPLNSNPKAPSNPSPSLSFTNPLPADILSVPLPVSPTPLSIPPPTSPFQTPSGSLQLLTDIGEDLCLSIGTHPKNVFQPTGTAIVQSSFSSTLPVPLSHSQTNNLFSGLSNSGMDIDSQTGSTSLRDAVSLQPFNPSSPPRKKAKGGKRKLIDSEIKPILDLNTDNWARYFVLKKKEGSFTNDCSFKMAKFFKNLLGKTKSVKKLGDGTLCIEAETKAQAEVIKSITKLIDAEVEAGPHRRLNTSQGVITCRDFLNSTIEDIKEGLAEEGVVDVRRIKRRQGDTLIDTASLVLTFDRPKPPTMINAAFYNLKVRPYIPSPMRCFRCQKFGHTSQRCKAPEQLCVCGIPTHQGDCSPPITCVNCGGEHNAKSSECPVLKEEKEIQKLKTLQQLPYQEARAIVKSNSYVNPEITYSQKTRSTPKIFEFQAALKNTSGQTKSTPSLGLRDKIVKVGEIPPPKLSAPIKGASVTVRLPSTLPASGGGVSEVGPILPQIGAPPDGTWQVAGPPRRSQRRRDPTTSLPSLQKAGSSKTKSFAGDAKASSKQPIRRSPRPKWEIAGTDPEASESDGGGTSDRHSTYKREATKRRPRKNQSN